MDPEREMLLKRSGTQSSKSYNPYLHRNVEHPTSNTDTLIHFLKSNIGTGILAMPIAFSYAGLYFGLVATLIIGFICTHSMHMIVRCSNELCHKLEKPSMDYSEVSYYALKTGPRRWRKYSNCARNTVNFFLCVTQLGFCCIYFVFVAENIVKIAGHLCIRTSLAMLLVPMIGLNFLKNLKYLVPISLCATFLSVTGIVIIFYFLLNTKLDTSEVNSIASWSSMPLFFSTAIYAFEGVGVVLPLENNMKTPEAFGGLLGVLTTGMTIVTSMYTAVGFYGYLKYGKQIQSSITLNLDQYPSLATTVQIMFALSIFLSCGLQYYIPIEIMGPWFRKRLSKVNERISDGICRVVLVLIPFCFAISNPNLGAFVSFIGAFGSSSLGLIFPPILEIIIYGRDGMGRFHWKLWKNIAIMSVGILGMVFGVYVSILKMIKDSSDE